MLAVSVTLHQQKSQIFSCHLTLQIISHSIFIIVNIILLCILFLIFNSHIYYCQWMCLKYFEVAEFHFNWFPLQLCVFYLTQLETPCQEGSPGFIRLSKGFMVMRRLRSSDLGKISCFTALERVVSYLRLPGTGIKSSVLPVVCGPLAAPSPSWCQGNECLSLIQQALLL